MIRRAVLFIAALGAVAVAVHSQEPELVTTRHQVTVAGTPLAYTARAGLLAIRDNGTGEPHGHVFFVA